MENNCLVTKLKSVVNNDNLPIFNAVRFKVNSSNGRNYVKLNFAGVLTDTTIKILNYNGSVYLSNDVDTNNWGEEHTYPANSYPWIRSNSAINDYVDILVTPKSKFKGFANDTFARQLQVDLDQFQYCEALTELYMNANAVVGGDISSLYHTSLSKANFRIEDDIAKFANIPTLSYIELGMGGLYGNFEPLGALPLLNLLVFDAVNIYGDIKKFIETRRIKTGQTTGTLATFRSQTRATFNGTVVTIDSNYSIDWDATSIIVKRGAVHKAYVYNITPKQRTDLINAGYTDIIDV